MTTYEVQWPAICLGCGKALEVTVIYGWSPPPLDKTVSPMHSWCGGDKCKTIRKNLERKE